MKIKKLVLAISALAAVPAGAGLGGGYSARDLINVQQLVQGTAEVSRRMTVEALMQQAAIAVSAEIGTQDTDGDGYVEPNPAVTAAIAPTGGGTLPASSAAPHNDSYGRAFGYCAWNNGGSGKAGASAGILAGSAALTAPVFSVISAGADGIFQTTCAQTAANTWNGDDVGSSFSTAQIRQGIGGMAYFGAPALNLAALNALDTATLTDGEIRLTTADNALWRYHAGVGWEPIAGGSSSGIVDTGSVLYADARRMIINNTLASDDGISSLQVTGPARFTSDDFSSAGILSTTDGTVAIKGVAHFGGIGVQGTAVNGPALYGYSVNGEGLLVQSDTGYAIRANGATSLNGTLQVTGAITASAGLIGNASTASALATGRTFSLTGDATGTSAAFNGSANASIPLTLAASGVSAGTYGSATTTPVFTVDTKGRVLGGVSTLITPAWDSLTGLPAGLSYAVNMNQNVRTTDTPTFAGVNSTGNIGLSDNVQVRNSTGKNYLDFTDGAFTNLANYNTVATTGISGRLNITAPSIQFLAVYSGGLPGMLATFNPCTTAACSGFGEGFTFMNGSTFTQTTLAEKTLAANGGYAGSPAGTYSTHTTTSAAGHLFQQKVYAPNFYGTFNGSLVGAAAWGSLSGVPAGITSYAVNMNQNVRTTDAPTFAGSTLTGNLTLGANNIVFADNAGSGTAATIRNATGDAFFYLDDGANSTLLHNQTGNTYFDTTASYNFRNATGGTTWASITSGGISTAGSVTATGGFVGNASTATNISNTGTVTLATATENNAITITAPAYGADQPVKMLNFDWYGNKWSLSNIRAGDSSSNGLGIYATNVEQARFTTTGLNLGARSLTMADNTAAARVQNATGDNYFYVDDSASQGNWHNSVSSNYYDAVSHVFRSNTASNYAVIGSSGLISYNANMYVGQGQNNSRIYMLDNDDGDRSIHNNSGTIGFLNSSGGWLQRNWDTGAFQTLDAVGGGVFNVQADGTIWSKKYGNLESKFGWYDGWVGAPGYDANTIGGSKSGFSYSNNTPWTGPLAHLEAGAYGLQFSASYNTSGCAPTCPLNGTGEHISFRTRNGDMGGWNSWVELAKTSGTTFTGQVNVNANLAVTGELYMGSGNWIRSQGSSGLYFESWGGGWNMQDSTYIRAYGGKQVYTTSQMKADGGFETPNNSGASLHNAAGTAYLKMNDGGGAGYSVLHSASDTYYEATNHFINNQSGALQFTLNANGVVIPDGTNRGLQNNAGTAWIRMDNTSRNTHIYNGVSGLIYSDAAGHVWRDSAGTTTYASLDGSGLYSRGNFITSNTSSTGLQNVAGTSWIRVADGSDSTHIYNGASGNIYIDANTQSFRNSTGGTTYATLNSSSLTLGSNVLFVASSTISAAKAISGTVTTGAAYAVYGQSTSTNGGSAAVRGEAATGNGGYFSSTLNAGVYGIGLTGIQGVATGSGNGVYGTSNTGVAIYGSAGASGAIAVRGYAGANASKAMSGENNGVNGIGVYGYGYGAGGTGVYAAGVGATNTGLYGTTDGASGFGVYASNTSATGTAVKGSVTGSGVGVRGDSASGYGVLGVSSSNSGVYGESTGYFGVYGRSYSGGSAGVYGMNTTASSYGVQGVGTIGVQGESTDAIGFGVRAVNSSATGVALYCSATAAGGCAGNKAWTNSSDGRLKTQVATIGNALALIQNLRGVRFNWNQLGHELQQQNMNERNIGFIAQELEPFVPELVVTRPDGYKAVNYAQMTAVLVEGIKEQHAEVQAYKISNNARVTTIESNLNLVTGKVTSLETRLGAVETAATSIDGRVAATEAKLTTYDQLLASVRLRNQTNVDGVTTAEGLEFNTPVFFKQNVTAEMVEAQLIKTKLLEAEKAKINDLEVGTVKTGEAEVVLAAGFITPVFELPAGDGVWNVSLSSDVAAYATAQVMVRKGILQVVPLAKSNLDIVVQGRWLKAANTGTVNANAKASWLKVG